MGVGSDGVFWVGEMVWKARAGFKAEVEGSTRRGNRLTFVNED